MRLSRLTDRHREDEHAGLDAGAQHLEAAHGCEQNLLLMRILREPRQVGPAVDHAHLNLEQCRDVMARCIADGHLAFRRRRGEAKVHTAA